MAAPWLMWGTTLHVDPLISALPSTENIQSQQIARINYGRPETWSFLLQVSVLSAPTGLGVVSVDVFLDVQAGIGRTVANFTPCALSFSGGGIGGQSLFTTVGVQAQFCAGLPSPAFVPVPIDHFPAQDIQASARYFATQGGGGPAVGQRVKLAITAMFAPKTHIRPDWYQSPAAFNGGEHKGM